MSNVLPPSGRKAVRRMYRARFLATTGFAVGVIGVLATLSLVPVYLALHTVALPNPGTAAAADAGDSAAIALAQAGLKVVGPLIAATTTPSLAIDAVLAARSAGVHITDISYAAGKSGTLTLSGSADSPSALDAYRKALAAIPGFASVSVPVSDLVGAQGGHFSMTVSGAF